MIIREATVSSQASQEMLRLTRIEQAELKPMRRSNSVDSLSPKSRFLNAMNTIPMTPGVRYNTIIGDRGRGDSPNSSDGVVPYWSSHMNGAENASSLRATARIRTPRRSQKCCGSRKPTPASTPRKEIIFGKAERPILREVFRQLEERSSRYVPLLIKLFPTAETRPRQREELTGRCRGWTCS